MRAEWGVLRKLQETAMGSFPAVIANLGSSAMYINLIWRKVTGVSRNKRKIYFQCYFQLIRKLVAD